MYASILTEQSLRMPGLIGGCLSELCLQAPGCTSCSVGTAMAAELHQMRLVVGRCRDYLKTAHSDLPWFDAAVAGGKQPHSTRTGMETLVLNRTSVSSCLWPPVLHHDERATGSSDAAVKLTPL